MDKTGLGRAGLAPNGLRSGLWLFQRSGSTGFVRNERLSQFLRFVVEQHLLGHDRGTVKESVIGTEVFGRKPGYNPKRDPIVRTEARRLRERLSEYYEGVGRMTRSGSSYRRAAMYRRSAVLKSLQRQLRARKGRGGTGSGVWLSWLE